MIAVILNYDNNNDDDINGNTITKKDNTAVHVATRNK